RNKREKSTFFREVAGGSPSPGNCGLTLAHLIFTQTRLATGRSTALTVDVEQPRVHHTRILRQEMDNGRPGQQLRGKNGRAERTQRRSRRRQQQWYERRNDQRQQNERKQCDIEWQ